MLDQVGLAAALRQLVAGYDTPQCWARIGELGDIPAGIEVAAYAIAAETVTNAVRHSGASRIDLSADVHDGSLVVEVRDNGCGVPARPAAEVGGRFSLLAAPSGGTVVRAELMIGHGTASIGPPPAGRTHGPEPADGTPPQELTETMGSLAVAEDFAERSLRRGCSASRRPPSTRDGALHSAYVPAP